MRVLAAVICCSGLTVSCFKGLGRLSIALVNIGCVWFIFYADSLALVDYAFSGAAVLAWCSVELNIDCRSNGLALAEACEAYAIVTCLATADGARNAALCAIVVSIIVSAEELATAAARIIRDCSDIVLAMGAPTILMVLTVLNAGAYAAHTDLFGVDITAVSFLGGYAICSCMAAFPSAVSELPRSGAVSWVLIAADLCISGDVSLGTAVAIFASRHIYRRCSHSLGISTALLGTALCIATSVIGVMGRNSPVSETLSAIGWTGRSVLAVGAVSTIGKYINDDDDSPIGLLLGLDAMAALLLYASVGVGGPDGPLLAVVSTSCPPVVYAAIVGLVLAPFSNRGEPKASNEALPPPPAAEPSHYLP